MEDYRARNTPQLKQVSPPVINRGVIENRHMESPHMSSKVVTNIEDELYEYEDLDGENYSYDFESDHAGELEPDEETPLVKKCTLW